MADAHAAGQPDRDAHDILAAELGLLRRQFRATPYPPTSTAPNAVALSKLVGRVEWVANNATLSNTGAVDLEPSVRAVLGSGGGHAPVQRGTGL